MRRSKPGITLLAGALLLAGCTTSATTPTAAPTAAQAEEPAAAGAADEDRVAGEPGHPRDEALAAALDRALDRPAERSSLHMFTECRRDAGLESVEIFGNGVAIRDNRSQFEVSEAEITAVLEAFEKADFAAMPDTFGGKVKPKDLEPPPRPEEGEAIFALRVICRVELSLGGRTKSVAQLDEGKQSEALRELAEEFFRVTEEPARAAVGASDLADGLGKIARGELAPETMSLMLHRKPEEPGAAEGFLLRVRGVEAVSRPVPAPSESGTGRALVLSPTELAILAGELAERDLEGLPINLYATWYTDFSVAVLDRKKSVQARRFAGMEPTTHGDWQSQFDDTLDLLLGLHRRVVADGSPVKE